MRFRTSRFGVLQIQSDAILLFPDGLIGFEQLRHFILLAEAKNPAVGWLQSLSDPEYALACVTPQRFIPSYALRIQRSQLISLPWSETDKALVLAIVSHQDDGTYTLNLQAPLLVNIDRCLGRQVVTADEQPVRFPLPGYSAPLRKSA